MGHLSISPSLLHPNDEGFRSKGDMINPTSKQVQCMTATFFEARSSPVNLLRLRHALTLTRILFRPSSVSRLWQRDPPRSSVRSIMIVHSLVTVAIQNGPRNKAGSLFGRFFLRLPLYATVKAADPRQKIASAEGLASFYSVLFATRYFSLLRCLQ